MKIVYYGHACFGIEVNQTKIIVDPFITGNPLAESIDINMLKVDYILVTHAHQDHTLDVEILAKKNDATIISNYEICMHYINLGLKAHPLNHGGIFKTEDFSAKFTAAVHTSSFPDGSYGGEPGGFLLTTQEASLYVAGDTALTHDMKLIPLWAQLDLAILPIGDTFTMGYQDAIIASDFMECNKIIGCHYNTFPPIEICKQEAQKAFKNHQKELILLKIGESYTV
ncbi:MAG: metal-dependent hydrolase [Flavobacteriales bacterium]